MLRRFLNPLRISHLPIATLAIALAFALQARTIVAPGADTVWKYLDEQTGPGAGWMQAGFDDAAWKAGKSPLGFGESRLGTILESRPFAIWLRREFDAPDLKPGESLALLLCVDDGAAVYLNGTELLRTNLPQGSLTSTTTALRTISDNDEGHYQRFYFPADSLQRGTKNVLAIEVHNISAKSSDLYFDAALKTAPAELKPHIAPEAEQVVNDYRKQHYLGPEVRIPDGYIDGGRGMKIDAQGDAASGREILALDRAHDAELEADLAFARSTELRALPERERIQKIAERIDNETTPFGGLRQVERATNDLEKDFEGKTIMIGDWLDQCHAGVCRHRSLLFKVLADEAGLKTALTRGNFMKEAQGPGFAHAWNEVFLSDGHHVIVDVMHQGGKPTFREVTDPYVIEHYHKVDNSPWYAPSTKS